MPKIKITLILVFFLFFIAAVSLAVAQDIGLESSLKTIANTSGLKTDATVASDSFLDTTVGGLIAIVLGMVGVLFLSLTIYSGIQWMTAGGNEDKVTKARQKIVNAAVGLGIVILAYVISNAVFNIFYQATEREATVSQTLQGPFYCESDDDCPGTMQCNVEGLCVCTDSDQCPGNLVCVDNQCIVECVSDDDCPPGQHCSWGGQCLPGETPGSECETNADCSEIWGDVKPFCHAVMGTWYYCVECEQDFHCTDQTRSIYDPNQPYCYTQTATPICGECGDDAHCNFPETCQGGSCM